MSKYRLVAYHLSQAVTVLLSRQDLRSKIKGTGLCLNREQLATMSAEEIHEFFGRGRLGKTVVL